jgi:hypothetical protein
MCGERMDAENPEAPPPQGPLVATTKTQTAREGASPKQGEHNQGGLVFPWPPSRAQPPPIRHSNTHLEGQRAGRCTS